MKLFLFQGKSVLPNFFIIKSYLEIFKDKDLHIYVIFNNKCEIYFNHLKKFFKKTDLIKCLNTTNTKSMSLENFKEIMNESLLIPLEIESDLDSEKLFKLLYSKVSSDDQEIYFDLTCGYKYFSVIIVNLFRKINLNTKISYLNIHSNTIEFLEYSSKEILNTSYKFEKFKIADSEFIKDIKIEDFLEIQNFYKKEFEYNRFSDVDAEWKSFIIYNNKVNNITLKRLWGYDGKLLSESGLNSNFDLIDQNKFLKSKIYKFINSVDPYTVKERIRFVVKECLEYYFFVKTIKFIKENDIDINFYNDFLINFKEKQNNIDEFEIDAVLKIKNKILILSVNAGEKYKNRFLKQHIFEVIHRAYQIGGEFAIPVIVSFTEEIVKIENILNDNNGFRSQIEFINVERIENDLKKLLDKLEDE